MPFHFRAWPATETFGQPEQAAESFNEVVAQLETRLLPEGDLYFEVIDIRPSTAGSREVRKFLRTVSSLFLEEAFVRDSLRPNSRLLFAGRAKSLSDWEPEGKLRSINKDVELFIRVLQSLGIGHYVCIDPDAARTSRRAGSRVFEGREWIVSALFAFHRYYSHVPNSGANAVALLEQVNADIAALFKSAQDRPGFEKLGVPGNYESDEVEERQDFVLLDEARLLYQLGKRDQRSKYNPDRLRRPPSTFEVRLPGTSYELLSRIEDEVPRWVQGYRLNGSHEMGGTGDPIAAQWLAGATFKMKRYEMLRDIARLIGSNALNELKNKLSDLEKTGSRDFLIIDDFIYYHLTDKEQKAKGVSNHIIDGIERVFGLVGQPMEACVVIPAPPLPRDTEALSADTHRDIFEEASKKPVTLNGMPAGPLQAPEKYAAILMDPEATSDALGPVRVQRLANYLRQVRLRAERDPQRPDAAARIPSIIAFSQRESSGHVQQCLNLGAAAFTAKHRPYHLLFDLNRVLADSRPVRPSTDRASQFRILRSLKPHTVAKLRRGSGPAYVHGGLYRDGQSGKPGLDDFLDDPREEGWIKSLPKADLHCHIGTCIDYATVELMALNTIGYMLGSKRLKGGPDDHGAPAADGAKDLFTKTAMIAALAADLTRNENEAAEDDSHPPALLRLAAAAAAIIRRDPGLSFKPFGMGDAIIKHIRSVDERFRPFEVAAVLVAMISLSSRREEGPPPYKADDGALTYLEALAVEVSQGAGPDDPESAKEFTTRSALNHALERAMDRLEEISHRWDGRFTEDQIRSTIQKGMPEDAIRCLLESVRRRTATAEGVLKAFLEEAKKRKPSASRRYEADREFALGWLQEHAANIRPAGPIGTELHPLEPYVLAARAPEGDGRRSGLQLYLQGADLLGSAHLQYPDNLLLATYAIARDNAADNIIYSEVRCETTGYTRAGMSARDATEMLRHGFNIASLFLATQASPEPAAGRGGGENPGHGRKWPLVRTNILLAAKRHKDKEEARKVVALLESYLERRPGDVELALSRLRFPQPFPSWWRPSEVVGFDISGDESKDQDWLTEVIKPLAARSSPITIHAGEAADAQSIWRAVYKLNATRIGHGLRLNEDQALLSYCVREGICMEMCPNSNAATNGFRCIPAFDNSPYPLLQYEYPLLQYMRAGMEVSLGTDNRYLHCPGRRDLTSEYVAAARLVGGLTRWEVLQIVKAGFKNAFLAKVEIREMLGAVEETIYSLVAADAS